MARLPVRNSVKFPTDPLGGHSWKFETIANCVITANDPHSQTYPSDIVYSYLPIKSIVWPSENEFGKRDFQSETVLKRTKKFSSFPRFSYLPIIVGFLCDRFVDAKPWIAAAQEFKAFSNCCPKVRQFAIYKFINLSLYLWEFFVCKTAISNLLFLKNSFKTFFENPLKLLFSKHSRLLESGYGIQNIKKSN